MLVLFGREVLSYGLVMHIIAFMSFFSFWTFKWVNKSVDNKHLADEKTVTETSRHLQLHKSVVMLLFGIFVLMFLSWSRSGMKHKYLALRWTKNVGHNEPEI